MRRASRIFSTMLIAFAVLATPLGVSASEEAPNESSTLISDISEEAATSASSESDDGTFSEEASEADTESEEDGEQKKLSSVQEARNGVLQVNSIYEDDLGKTYIISGGAGFLIGSSEDSEYVITNNHIINPDKKIRDKAFKAIGVDKKQEWDKINLKSQVVLEGDVVLNATVVNASKSMDIVVLKLEQPIYTRTPLTILTADSKTGERPYKVADKTFTLGYPTGITYENPIYYSNDKVSMTSGAIANLTTLNGASVIQHDAKIDDSNCGGPLIDEDGLVIGVNILADDGSNFYSLETVELTAILDGLGIEYSKMTKEEYTDLKTEKEPEVAVTPPVYPVDPGKEKGDDSADIRRVITTIIIIVAALLIIAVITLVTILIVKKIKEAKENNKKIEEENNKNRFEGAGKKSSSKLSGSTPKVQSNEGAFNKGNETTILGASSGEAGTTMLSGSEPIFLGTLIRRKNGENIIINKDNFTIGKDSLNIDFRISDNSAISRRHATIKKAGAQVVIEDNHSTNGTFVNGEQLTDGQPRSIKSGDVIKLANEEFDFRK